MEMCFSYMKMSKYLCFFFTVILLTACSVPKTEEKKTSCIDQMLNTLVKREDPLITQSELEDLLIYNINRSLYYNINDYKANYIGQSIQYVAVGSILYPPDKDDKIKDEYDVQVFLNPPGDSTFESTFSDLFIYDMFDELKYSFNPGTGTIGGNLLTMDFDEKDGFASMLEYARCHGKLWYTGEIYIDDISKPEVVDFDGKEAIIDNIYKWMENRESQGFSYNDFGFEKGEVIDKIDLYIQNFNENDAETVVLIAPDDKLEDALEFRYNIITASNDYDIYHYSPIDFTDEYFSKKAKHFFKVLKESTASSKTLSNFHYQSE